MLTLKDCCDFCALTEEEVDAIAEHEHIPRLSAAEVGRALLQTGYGVHEIDRFMREDIAVARSHHDSAKARQLERVLAHFIETHPL